MSANDGWTALTSRNASLKFPCRFIKVKAINGLTNSGQQRLRQRHEEVGIFDLLPENAVLCLYSPVTVTLKIWSDILRRLCTCWHFGDVDECVRRVEISTAGLEIAKAFSLNDENQKCDQKQRKILLSWLVFFFFPPSFFFGNHLSMMNTSGI